MKFENKNLRLKMAGAVLLATMCLINTGCNKQKEINQNDPNIQSKISVSIAGILDKSIESTVLKSSNRQSESAQLLEVKHYGEFDASVSIDGDLPSQHSDRRVIASNHRVGSGTKAAIMDPGKTFRLFLFKTDGSYVGSSALESGTPESVDVEQGMTYNWYAISFNNAENIPDITESNPEINLTEGKDVLHAAGQITIPTGTNVTVALPITFNRKTSRVAVELNSMGMFGSMTNATVSVSGLSIKTGSINIVNGQWSDLTNSNQVINWSSFSDVDPLFQDRKIAYVYTVDSTSSNNVVVSVSNLGVNHADGNTRNFSATPVNFVFNSIQADIGSSQRLLLNLVESPLTVTQGGVTVHWARSNLYYEAGHNPYRFYGINALNSSTDGKGYFAFGSIIPRKFHTSGLIGDPCAEVYPKGVWRQPKNTEFAPLTTADGLLTDVLGNILGILVADPAPNASGDGTYIQYPITSGGSNPGFLASSNQLRFYYNGEITDVNVVTDFGPDGLVNLDLGTSHGTQGALWTNVSGTNLLNLIGLGAWGYHASDKSTIFGSNFIGAIGTAELLSDVNVGGLDLVSSTFKSVRCVRN